MEVGGSVGSGFVYLFVVVDLLPLLGFVGRRCLLWGLRNACLIDVGGGSSLLGTGGPISSSSRLE